MELRNLENITLLVPEILEKAVVQGKIATDLSLDISSYKKIKPNFIKELEEKPIILVADIKDLKKEDYNQNLPFNSRGKLLIMGNLEEIKAASIPANHCIDLLDRDPSIELLKFKLNKAIYDIGFDKELELFKVSDQKQKNDLEALNEIGMALSTEKDLNKLLDLIVSKSRQMTWSDAGSLYLIETDPNLTEEHYDYFSNKRMRFQVSQNDSRKVPFKSLVVDIKKTSIYGYVALTQESLNFPDVYHIPEEAEYSWGGREFDAAIKYRTMSMLTVPMINWRGETIGVIQLINGKKDPKVTLDDPKTCVEDIQPYTPHDVRMAMSIASQASIAIQNTQLVNSIRTLFEGFIDASVRAIESRDPTTAGHSQRVATLTEALAEKIDQSEEPKFKPYRFTRENLQEIRYASLLHDFGKIGVREHVLVKAKKLYPHELQALQDRYELIRTTLTMENYKKRVLALEVNNGTETKALINQFEDDLNSELAHIDEVMAFTIRCNEPTVLAQGGFERLNDIAKMNYRTLVGEDVSFINDKELQSLSVPRGSLTEQDRKEIESHVTHTYKFLSTIPWTSDLRNVAEIAYAHHEKLDGTGYPNRLTSEGIPIQSKMMTISDIFDALTAMDRPYKKALPAERALNILMEEAKAQHVDDDLLRVFVESEVYKMVL